ncbi:MAG: hypothetical protein UW27_C0012G0001, partial [Parcubacteria group bacterium GW2011_GWA1_44_13]
MFKKIIRIFRNSFLFLVIFSVTFSNVPFYVLSGAMEGYVKTANIVDRAWHLSQDDNVVDKLNSFKELAGWVKIHEARAAVALRGTNKQGVASNGGDVTLTFDTGGGAPQQGDVVILWGGRGNSSDATAWGPITTGYNAISTINSTGPKFGVWYKVMGVTPDTQVQGEGGAGAAHGVVYGAYVIDGTTIDPVIFDQTAVSTGQLSSWVPNGPAIVTQTDGALVVTHAAASATDSTRGTVSGYTILTGGTVNETDDFVSEAAYVVAGAPGTYDPPAWGTWAAGIGGAITIAFKPAPPPADTTPPTPDPMTFATAPANTSATQIDMTASTATDATTPPVSYYFALDTTSCTAANIGTGAADSGWQSGTTYSDIGLGVNKCYGYKVKARDSVGTPNETGYSGITTLYTSANTPGTPILGSPTTSTLALTNAENSNPASNPTTNFAVQVVTTTPSDATWLNQWVDATGNPSATAVWLTDAQLDALVLQGLQASTLYGVKVKARNNDTDETALSAEGQGTTSAPATTLTISQTAGSKVTTQNSGDVNQYAHDTACTGAGTCSAFTLASAGGTTNVTSIKITETGSATANTELSDLNLYYDTDGNWADAGAETLFGTTATFAGDQTATVSGTLAISDGATAYIYARYDLANGAVYPTGGATVNFQITASTDVVSDATESGSGTLAGTQTVKPQITSYTNSTESGLNYAGACTGCGARIGGGSGFRQTVV